MRKSNKKYILSALMGLAMTAIIPAFAADYINAESFAEANGISHQWFPIQKMLIMRKGLNSIKFRVGENTAIANEKEIKLSATPRIQNNVIFIPADSLKGVFPGARSVPSVQMTPTNQNTTFQSSYNNQNNIKPAVETPVRIQTQVQPVDQPNIYDQPSQDTDSILLALRHSLREDHTRVVLEFSNPVSYKSDFKNGIYRLTISGCKNLIPTKRTDPVGRDISKLDINSGANREGLILTFTLTQKEKTPTIETVADPFRMIVELPSGTPLPEVASAPASITPPIIKTDITPEQPTVNVPKPPEMEKPPEINIEVPLETLQNKSFLGRTIVIDPGHGGSDPGFEYPGRPPEKTINLETAKYLKEELEKAGFKAVLLRTSDTTLNSTQRLSLANKNGGDLHIAIHTGGSNDNMKHGVACFTFTDKGLWYDNDIQGATYDNVFAEWLKTTRFDLAEFLAKKINNRLTKHLQVESRGVTKSPLLPLKFIMNPAVLVEIGMLSDKVEGKNLISDKYKQAIAKSITNAVIDFFNGIELK
jgi:N-acetylmuramoyl-L-alanine amidase